MFNQKDENERKGNKCLASRKSERAAQIVGNSLAVGSRGVTFNVTSSRTTKTIWNDASPVRRENEPKLARKNNEHNDNGPETGNSRREARVASAVDGGGRVRGGAV